MSAASVQCPLCFTRSPAPAAGGAVQCPSCAHAFTPPSALPPPRKNPDVPYVRVLSTGGTAKSEPKPAEPQPARRADEGDRPRTRSRRRYDDDEPAKRGGSALPLALIAGGVLAVLTLGGVVAVGAVLFARPAVATAPVAVASPPPWAIANPDEVKVVSEPVDEPPDPRFPERPWVEMPGRVAPRPGEKLDPNTNAVITKHKAKLNATASTQWQNWPVTHLLDGKEATSWYSNTPDNTFEKVYPWVMVAFPEDVSVKRVTILGNRDPEYPSGYTVTEGTLELLDANGKVISTHAVIDAGEKFDFDLRLDKPTTVRAVRFTMTKSVNGSCGLGEFQVE